MVQKMILVKKTFKNNKIIYKKNIHINFEIHNGILNFINFSIIKSFNYNYYLYEQFLNKN